MGGGRGESAGLLLGRIAQPVWAATAALLHDDLGEDHGTAFSVRLSEAGKIRLYQHLERTGLRVVALVHTHPDSWVDLSPIDEDNQISSRVGVWSLVLPYYGHPSGWNHGDIGVHVRAEKGWKRLSAAEAASRVLLDG